MLAYPDASRRWNGHPLWLVGFRPFFLVACLSGAVLPLLWAAMFSGVLCAPPGLSALQWHAHEMFYGFGFAVVGGFLLTASKNWVKTRGHYGFTLQFLVLAWLFERALIWWLGAGVHAFIFPIALGVAVSWTLVRGRKHDSYRDNGLFIFALTAFVLARAALLSTSYFDLGRDLSVALFRLIFVVMLERTIPPFMRSAFKVELRRVSMLDVTIKVLAVSLVSAWWWPTSLRTVVESLLAALLFARFMAWHPLLALRRVEVAVMYVGGLCLALQLVLSGAWVGAMPLHVFTFGTMGLIIPAMLLRIAQGHTGRPVVFGRVEQVALAFMFAAGLARVVAPQVMPAWYQLWVALAAFGWAACFVIVGIRIAPMLWAERVDGREH